MNNIIEQFNGVVLSLLKQLSSIIGVAYINQFENIIRCNALLPIEQFSINALPLRDKILARDATYFNTNDDYCEKIKDDTYTLNEILRLKDIYNNLDEDSQKNIWDFFQAMLILSEEFIILRVNKN